MATDKDLERQVKRIADVLSDASKFEAQQKEYLGEDYDEDEHNGPMAWLSDVLDIRYIVSGHKENAEFISAQVLVAFGGPNIWVNFDTKEVKGYWGGDTATAYFVDDLGVEDALEELYNC